MRVNQPWQKALRFCGLFVLYLGLLALVFEYLQLFFVRIYMYPVSSSAAFLLNGMGIEAVLDTSSLLAGFCDLVVEGAIYRIIHECTGIFALLTFLALLLAYPASVSQKVQGAVLGIPAFFMYSSLRLVVLGAVATLKPEWVETFHLYMMVLVNIGFMFFVWMYWVARVIENE